MRVFIRIFKVKLLGMFFKNGEPSLSHRTQWAMFHRKLSTSCGSSQSNLPWRELWRKSLVASQWKMTRLFSGMTIFFSTCPPGFDLFYTLRSYSGSRCRYARIVDISLYLLYTSDNRYIFHSRYLPQRTSKNHYI